ncbi:cytochrome P450 [Coniochaeta sp. 2T2.1]|nr:cytochrome P450 [Coniochaeta sp. 2T2.1]
MPHAKISLQAWLAGATPPRVLVVSLAASTIFLFAYIIYQRVFSPLSKVNGPFWASLSPTWKLLKMMKGDFHETIVDLHEEYGPIVRIAPNEVIISDKTAIREIYSTTQGRDFLKTDYYDAFKAFRPTIFGQRDPHLHAKRKRIVSHGYSMSALQAMETYVQSRLQIFLTKMRSFSLTGETINLSKWCHFFAFDVIGELAFSEGFGMLESGVEDEHIRLIEVQMEFGSTVGMVPFLQPLTKWTFLPVPWLRSLQAGRERLKELTQSRVERRRNKVSDRKDILGRLIEAVDPVTGEKLDPIDLRTEAFSSIVAGSDSTSSALSYMLHQILTHPDVHRTLVSELRSAFPSAPVSSPPTYAQLAPLPYLQACIKESLRLTPPATVNLPRYVPPGGRVVAGTYFPGGVTVGMSCLPVHLDTETFGVDARTYRPERWLGGAETPGGERVTPEEMMRYWIPFGVGSRACIGKNVAMLELVKLIGTLLLYFDVEVQYDKKPEDIPKSKSYFFARMREPVMVTLRERQ